MKKRIVIILLLVMVAGTAIASGVKNGGFGLFDKIATELNLTPEQKTQIEPIVEKYKQKAKALRANNEGDRRANREAMHGIIEEAKTEIFPLLTADQIAKVKEFEEKKHKHHEQKGAIKAAVKNYADKEVKPVLQAQRMRLEAKLSAEDKQAIDELRVVVKEQKKACKKSGECKGKGRKGKGEFGENRTQQNGQEEAGRGRRGGKRGHHLDEATRTAVDALVAKYEANINALLDETKASHGETWKTEIKAIVLDIAPDMEERMNERVERDGKKDKWTHRFFHPAKFLLSNPYEAKNESLTDRTIGLYPNPAQKRTNIKYEVLKEGEVQIGIYNRGGDLVKTVFTKYQQPGSYNVEANLDGLADKMYIISVTDAAGKVSEQLLMK